MNLLNAVKYLRDNILDDIGGFGVTWQTTTESTPDSLQLRWTNEELTSNINEAVTQVYRRILPVTEVNPIFDITTVQGIQEYPLDPRILQIEGIRCKSTGKTICRVDLKEVWNDRTLLVDEGDPSGYIPNYNTGSIHLYKVPKDAKVYEMMVHRLPLLPLDWTTNTLQIELREEFIIPMLWYAASLCYDKDEANVLDPDRSNFFMSKFISEFTTTSAYSDTRKRKTTNRSTSYGGIS